MADTARVSGRPRERGPSLFSRWPNGMGLGILLRANLAMELNAVGPCSATRRCRAARRFDGAVVALRLPACQVNLHAPGVLIIDDQREHLTLSPPSCTSAGWRVCLSTYWRGRGHPALSPCPSPARGSPPDHRRRGHTNDQHFGTIVSLLRTPSRPRALRHHSLTRTPSRLPL